MNGNLYSRRRRAADILALCIFPATILVSVGIARYETDLLRYYAWTGLVVELGLLYYCSRKFMERYGGAGNFGGVRISIPEWIFAVVAGLGLFYLVTALGALLQLFYQWLGFGGAGSSALPAGGGWRLFASMFLLGVLPGLAEETFFRGTLLFSWLPQGKWRAIVHSGALFALLHGSIFSLPVLFGMGLLLGYVAEKAGSTRASMGIHISYNIAAVLYSYLATVAAGSRPEAAEQATSTFGELAPAILQFLLLGLAIGFFSLRALLRAAKLRQLVVQQALEGQESGAEVAAPSPPAEEGEAPQAENTPAAPVKRGGWVIVLATYIILILYNLSPYIITAVAESVRGG